MRKDRIITVRIIKGKSKEGYDLKSQKVRWRVRRGKFEIINYKAKGNE